MLYVMYSEELKLIVTSINPMSTKIAYEVKIIKHKPYQDIVNINNRDS